MTAAAAGMALIPSDLAYARDLLPMRVEEQRYSPRQIIDAIVGHGDLPELDTPGSIDPILARALAAASLDDAINETETTGIENLLGRVVELSNPRWFPSDYKGGARCFAVVEAVVTDTGLVSALVVGSAQPQVVIWRAMVEGKLPLVCRFAQSAKPTKAGFYPFSIVRA